MAQANTERAYLFNVSRTYICPCGASFESLARYSAGAVTRCKSCAERRNREMMKISIGKRVAAGWRRKK